jgi:HD-like signal output (HDOD) protein
VAKPGFAWRSLNAEWFGSPSRVSTSELSGGKVLDLHRLIAKAYDLEAIPMSGTKLANLIADPESSLESIIEIVSLDQALTARALRAANSAASAARSQITTVRDAVVRLGRSTIVALGFGVKMRQQLQQPLPEFGLGENVLWRHSVAAALAVESMGVLGKASVPPESYAAALLHDIGKLVLARFLDPDLQSYLRRAQEEGRCNPLQAEMEILEVNHAELGGIIARHWGLPNNLALGIQYHHSPNEDLPPVCRIVCVANQLAKVVIPESLMPQPHPEDHSASFDALGIDGPMKRKICDAVAGRFAKVMELFEAP